MKIRILKAFYGYRKDSIVTVDVDATGVPVERFWRRRFSDASRDLCIEILPEEKKPAKKIKAETETTGEAE